MWFNNCELNWTLLSILCADWNWNEHGQENSETEHRTFFTGLQCPLIMLSSGKVADFTTGVSNSVLCQHCLQSFEDGMELYYMQDSKSDRGGKRVCTGCRQYYLRKTEARKSQPASSVSLYLWILSNLTMSLHYRSRFRFCADRSGCTAGNQLSGYTESHQRSSKTR